MLPEDLLLSEFTPHVELVAPQHAVNRSRFVSLDAHNHLPAERYRTNPTELRQLLGEMDALNVGCIANLSGGWGDNLRMNISTLDQAFPGRFITLCNIDWQEALSEGWLEHTLKQLEVDVKAGARGLKIFKELGLVYRDPAGRLIMPDDPRIAPIWERAGALGVPVLIHTADPTAFFKPLNGSNERWDELHRHPEWHFYDPKFPECMELIQALYRVIAAHPATTFITAHVGCYAENLGFVSEMLERCPNMLTDISARVAELGRAPYSAHRFFNAFADRILFGTDGADMAGYRVCFRFLETADEYFSYAPNAPYPPQGRWNIYGITLDDEVLRKIYWKNAAKAFGME